MQQGHHRLLNHYYHLFQLRYDFVSAGYVESKGGERIPHYGSQQDVIGNVQEVFVPKWKFLVQTIGTKYKYYYYVDAVTGEVSYRYGNDK